MTDNHAQSPSEAIQVPPEEIRLAVVLNGGVSLAVWMGGAALELNRLRQGAGVYGSLLRLAGCSARIDVIAGTSAGGINGAALALAQANSKARLQELRDVWTDQGQIDTLLRKPFRGNPTSLLQGDEYFLPRLNEAMARLTTPYAATDPQQCPVDLTITTTLLRGAQKVTVDSSGQRLPQWVHDGRFHFVRGDQEEADPFSSARIGETADRLGLAARCTASFPVAFEPTFVPVDRGPRAAGFAAEDRLRPDMAEAASWAVQNRDEPGWVNPPPGTHVDVSRFAVDGGLLANMPTRPALRAIDSMPAEGPVRRVLVLVHPHAPSELRESADDPKDEPSLAGSLGSLLAALTAQGSRTFVEQIEQHNLTAAGRRGTRADIMRTLDGSARLSTLAGTVFEQYRMLRMWRYGRDTAAYVEPRPGWNAERVRRNARLAQEHWFEERKKAGGPRPFLPYVPISLKAPAASGWGWGTSAAIGVADAAADVLRRLIWVLPMGEAYRTVQEARHEVALLRKKLQASRRHSEEVWRTNPVLRDLEPTQTLFTLRLAKYEWSMLGAPNAAALRALRGELRTLIDAVASHEGTLIPDEAAGSRRAEQVRAALSEALIGEGPGSAANSAGAAGTAIAALVGEVVSALQPALRILHQVCSEHGPNVDAELAAWGSIFGPQVGDVDLLNKLLALEVATTTLGDELSTEYTLPLELVQLSAQTPNGFAAASRTADEKLGGMALSRFGGFLKRSWRLNDWTWGRIDAATVLCRMLLEPSRLRRAAELSGHPIGGAAGAAASARVLGELIGEWFGPVGAQDDGPPIPDWQGLCTDAAAELALVYSDRATGDLPPSLPRLAELAAWAIHMRVIAEELPALGRAVRADALAGANPRSNGELLVVEHGDLIRRLGEQAARHTDAAPLEFTENSAADAVAGLRAFDRAGVGRESLRDEGTSDQMLRTATSAAAVAATVVDSERSGLAAAKPVTRSLRGGMLLPYWVVTGLTTGGALSRAMSLLGLSIGAVLLTLALFGALPAWASGAGAAIGASALLLAFAYGALRTGTLLHSLVLLSPVIPLLAFAFERSQDAGADAGSKQGAATLLFVVALSLGLMIIGSLPAPMLSVWGELDRIADRADIPRVPGDIKGSSLAAAQSRRRIRAVLATLRRPLGTVFVVAIGAAAIFLALNSGIWEDIAEGVVEHRALALGAVLLLAWLGLYTAYKQGGSLRIAYDASGSLGSDTPVWRWHPVRHPAGVVVGWAALYGCGYLLLSGLLLWDPWDWLATWWGRALLATCLIFAVALLLLVPLVLPWRTKLRIERAQTEYVYQQLRLGRAPHPVDIRGLALTRRGKRLAARIGDSIEHQGREDKAEDRMRLLRDLVERGHAYRFLVHTSVFTAAQWTPTEWGAHSLTTTFTAPPVDDGAGRPGG